MENSVDEFDFAASIYIDRFLLEDWIVEIRDLINSLDRTPAQEKYILKLERRIEFLKEQSCFTQNKIPC